MLVAKTNQKPEKRYTNHTQNNANNSISKSCVLEEVQSAVITSQSCAKKKQNEEKIFRKMSSKKSLIAWNEQTGDRLW